MNHKRPVNLDLGSLKYPPMAIASILHRISGLVLFLLLPFMLYLLGTSLRSAESFDHMQQFLTCSYCKLLLWAFSAALMFHLLAGLRHILTDIGFGEHLSESRTGAIIVMALSLILTVLLGVWIW